MAIHCLIVSRYHIVYDGIVDIVLLPSITGQLGILENHVRLYTKLQNGIITLKTEGGDLFFTSTGGIAEVKPDQVRVLVDSSENIDDIDYERAEEARNRAVEMMAGIPSHSSSEFMKAMMLMKKSTMRMNAYRKLGRRRPSSKAIKRH
jgi:F-type H+-transporting ATPase subunit epsilon